MEKIKSLLEKIASKELASQICEHLERYDEQVRLKYQKIFEEKTEHAKQVCLEEVNQYKLNLAEKVKIFLESKSSQIEKRVDQQRAIEEGEAANKLRTIREVTEGIEVRDDAELKALKEEISKLRKRNKNLVEDKNKAVIAANKANQIALDVLERTKKLTLSEEKPAFLKDSDDPKADDDPEAGCGPEGGSDAKGKGDDAKGKGKGDDAKGKGDAVAESKKKNAKIIAENRSRRVLKAKPKTKTTSVITESRKKPSKSIMSGDNDIMNIANQL